MAVYICHIAKIVHGIVSNIELMLNNNYVLKGIAN